MPEFVNQEKEVLKKEMQATIETERQKPGGNGYNDELLPLSWDEIPCREYIENQPKEIEHLYENILPRGLVSAIFATGGVGKTYFFLQAICVSLATGKAFGPFRPVRKNKVLYINAEDPPWEIHRRVYLIAQSLGVTHLEDVKNNLRIFPGVGKVGPIMQLDAGGNPVPTAYYDWLRKSIENINNLDVLVLDPKSRLYGLKENDNDHNTIWVQHLERINYKYNISTFFSHHEPKSASSENKDLKDSTGRGGGALRDACRWTLSMRHMTKEDGSKFSVLSPVKNGPTHRRK